ncbi:DUF2975 domain-containing protein [Flavobacterium aciduliphilum]|uniref:DUF2975 family protein n=1 Tax=Flavobacterium aciduliphilum TaxID=1101402 RepID=A0A328YRT7_9FLAO|nr:DUF2975 domain-containing protein [Flavobacterium aciduliphilum]RAR72816.1 Protein of unknown function (DUF2975) [Flavobacterium aciduliphilum]
MKTTTDFTFKLLNVLSWIIFIGLAIDTGGYITNTIYMLFFNSNVASRFWRNLDLSDLYNYDLGFFICFTVVLIIVSLLKTILFYQTVSVFHKKKFNLANPFNETIKNFIFKFAFIAFAIGLFSYAGKSFSNWLISQGLQMPALENVKLGGADVWLFMGITLLIFAKIFKKGIELQTENELTV